MNTISRSLLILALVGSFIPAKAMESSDQNNNNNNLARYAPKFIFEDANREDGLGALAELPNEKIFEIMLFCINWDKTTLEEAFRVIQNLSETSKYIYTFVHSLLFNAESVNELRDRIVVLMEMEHYKVESCKENPKLLTEYKSGLNALHIAVDRLDITFLKNMLPKLKQNNLLHLLNERVTLNSSGSIKLLPVDCMLVASELEHLKL